MRRPDGLTEDSWYGRRRLPRFATEAKGLGRGELVPRRLHELLLTKSQFPREGARGPGASWLFGSRRRRWLCWHATHSALRGLTFELTGPRRRDGLARAGKMYRVPQAGPRQPAVGGPVVQRGVRPRSLCWTISYLMKYPATRQVPSVSRATVTVSTALALFSKAAWNWSRTY